MAVDVQCADFVDDASHDVPYVAGLAIDAYESAKPRAREIPEVDKHAGNSRGGVLDTSVKIYVAPLDRHMLVADGHLKLSHGPQDNLFRPAIDPLFRSVALVYGPAAVGVILTGQLNDGTSGLIAIKDRGGIAIAQDPADATARSMPASALRHVAIDYCCTLAEWSASWWSSPMMRQARPALASSSSWRSRTASPLAFSTSRTGGESSS